MAARVRVAQYLAENLQSGSGRKEAVARAAAWLVQRGRSRDAEYLASDVAVALVESGYVYGRITTARSMSTSTRQSVEDFLRKQTGAKTIELDEQVDESLIGGVRIDLPSLRLDATVRHQLNALIEGTKR